MNLIKLLDGCNDIYNFCKQNNLNYKEDNDVILLYNSYNKLNKSELEIECRSVVLDKKTKNIISYTFDDIIYNEDAKHYILNNKIENEEIIQCYDGTFLTLFWHDKWYFSTRKTLDCNTSFWQNNKSHYKLFEECILSKNLSVNDFCNKLDKNVCYYFILVHHENKNVVDYTFKFGENYKELVLCMARNKQTQDEINVDNIKLDNVTKAEKYDSLQLIDNENKKGYVEMPVKNEGLIVKVTNGQKTKILKFQTSDYLFSFAVGGKNNIYKGFISLYQNNELKNFICNNKNLEKYKFIKANDENEYDTLGMVDALFKVCSSEVFVLFKMFWDIGTGNKKNNDLYNVLPALYKSILFGIRGIYFLRKSEHINNKQMKNYKSTESKIILKLVDIYNYFKTMNVDKFFEFIEVRNKFLKELQEKNDKGSKMLKTMSDETDKVMYKVAMLLEELVL